MPGQFSRDGLPGGLPETFEFDLPAGGLMEERYIQASQLLCGRHSASRWRRLVAMEWSAAVGEGPAAVALVGVAEMTTIRLPSQTRRRRILLHVLTVAAARAARADCGRCTCCTC
jgi:hypothetical protein